MAPLSNKSIRCCLVNIYLYHLVHIDKYSTSNANTTFPVSHLLLSPFQSKNTHVLTPQITLSPKIYISERYESIKAEFVNEMITSMLSLN